MEYAKELKERIAILVRKTAALELVMIPPYLAGASIPSKPV